MSVLNQTSRLELSSLNITLQLIQRPYKIQLKINTLKTS